jgi:hypothetical protein
MIDELTRIAVVGTSRASGIAPLDEEHPADSLLMGLTSSDTESAFLLRAGVQAVFAAAGRMAEPNVTAVDIAPAETMRTPGVRLLGILQNAMASDSKDLFGEMLRQMAAGNLHLPHELLPEALSVSDSILREQIIPVLGERGRWLSRFNPQWSWVHDGIETLTATDRERLQQIWDEGAIAERCRVLATWRQSDPANARDELAKTIAQESADHRGRLIGELETGLTPADEEFLEKCLDDRSSGVRQIAAELLSRLSESALSLRMRDRANTMLTAAKTGIIFKTLKVTCSPPESIDKTWERDGISQKPPGGLGKRAFWAESVLRAVPPGHWVRHLGAEPAALIEAVREDTFGQSVLLGWSRACVRFATTDPASGQWVKPLWDYWDDVGSRAKGMARIAVIEEMKPLVSVMSGSDAEQNVLELLRKNQKTGDAEAIALLERVPRPWSTVFSERTLQLTRTVIQKSSDNFAYQWLSSLHLIAKAIPPEIFAAALVPWDLTAHQTNTSWALSSVEREIERFQETIRLRQSFHQEVTA